MKIETSNYQFAHGHGPRGHGSWAFEVRVNNAWSLIWIPGQHLYSVAARQAVAKAKEIGGVAIRVAT